jgi:hypothetical protein
MRRAVLMAVATMSLFGVNAMADNFTFSFTDPTNGTVTGEIFGLQNDGMYHPATEVLITSAPASFGSFDPIATNWDVQDANSFQETGGVITVANFLASYNTVSGYPELSLLPNITSSGITESFFITDSDGIGGVISFAPVPEPSAWFLLLTVIPAVAIVKRSRRTSLIR